MTIARRRSISLFALAAICAAPIARASAQSSPLSWTLGGGALAPSGDFGTYANTGWIGYAGLAKRLAANPRLLVEASVFYGHAAHDGPYGDATNIPGASAGLRYELGTGTVKPYLAASAGFLQHRYDPGSTGDVAESETKPFGAIGGGLMFGRIFVDARFAGASGTSFMPLSAGVRLGGN